jgi:hypothetical protein
MLYVTELDLIGHSMCVPLTPSNTKATRHGSSCSGYCSSPTRWTDVVRKLCRDRISEAYLCREKWREISRRFSDFWLPNALLAANLSGNPANLWVNGAFLGDDRPPDEIGIVLCGPFVTTCGGLPEIPRGLLKAQRQTFHGEAANLSDKAHGHTSVR